MSLKFKIVSSLLLILLFFVAVQFVTEKTVILPGFEDLQKAAAVKDAHRCEDAIVGEASHLGTLSCDWSAWDDTCRFIADRNNDFIKSNLSDSLFETANINLLYFYNSNGEKYKTPPIVNLLEKNNKGQFRWTIMRSISPLDRYKIPDKYK